MSARHTILYANTYGTHLHIYRESGRIYVAAKDKPHDQGDEDVEFSIELTTEQADIVDHAFNNQTPRDRFDAEFADAMKQTQLASVEWPAHYLSKLRDELFKRRNRF